MGGEDGNREANEPYSPAGGVRRALECAERGWSVDWLCRGASLGGTKPRLCVGRYQFAARLRSVFSFLSPPLTGGTRKQMITTHARGIHAGYGVVDLPRQFWAARCRVRNRQESRISLPLPDVTLFRSCSRHTQWQSHEEPVGTEALSRQLTAPAAGQAPCVPAGPLWRHPAGSSRLMLPIPQHLPCVRGGRPQRPPESMKQVRQASATPRPSIGNEDLARKAAVRCSPLARTCSMQQVAPVVG